jgi:hypothetical protein
LNRFACTVNFWLNFFPSSLFDAPQASRISTGTFLVPTLTARARKAARSNPLPQGDRGSGAEPRAGLFSNIKAWLVGTHHGVSAKHLPRYLREWSYRFNRRTLADGLDGYLIRRAVECATITYDQLTQGVMPGGAARVRRLPVSVAQPASAG